MAAEPVAIVGVACRLPGSANDLDSFWDLLAMGGEAWSRVPADRFNESAFYHPNANDPNGTNNHQGGHFIDQDVRDFDHAFFHTSPQQAAAMDPQQRILLELAYEALENAGWTRDGCAGSRTAVYAAIFGMDYERILSKDVLNLPVYQSVGTGTAILANRISHAFDLRGPSVTIDTGCSGGLVALHHACRSLRAGEADAALVGSANLQLMPDHYIGMSNQHMVSSHGRCFPFDVRGDGYGRGEGFVMVALKRLSDALRDRDPIRSVILNTGINQDGYTASGITHPNREAQADLIRATYAAIGLRPEDVLYVEAHGTGTVAGDHEELAALADVFGTTNRSLPLYVGSNKGSIGHTESTSGLASLLKAIATLRHRVIPPVAGFRNPKPGLPLKQIQVPTQAIPWPEMSGLPLRISINSFGYGGANAHAIIQSSPDPPERHQELPETESTPYLYVFSANSQASLKSRLESQVDWLKRRPQVSLRNLSYTLCLGRSALLWRASCVAASRTALEQGIQLNLKSMMSKATALTKEFVMIFTGQGAQWAGMGRELLLEATPSSIFRQSIRDSRDTLCSLGAAWDLEEELLRLGPDSNLDKAELAQPCTTALQIALVSLLRAQGVVPTVVIGHSSGEIAAAYAAGRLSKQSALYVAYNRGLMAAAVKEHGLPKGGMLSVGLGEEDASTYIKNLKLGQAVIACVNSPSSVTVSGDDVAVEEVASRIKAHDDRVFTRKLRVDTAYHSHHMRVVSDQYRSRLDQLAAIQEEDTSEDGGHGEATLFVSSVTGRSWKSGFNTSYWVDNLTSPVRFSDAVQEVANTLHMRNVKHAFFVEVGPHDSLAGPVRQCLGAPNASQLEYDYLSVLKRNTDAVSSILLLASRFFERGVKLDFNNIVNLSTGCGTATKLVDLPSYPWDHSTKHWHESRLSEEYRFRKDSYHDLLGVCIPESTFIEPRWRHMVGLTTLPWLADHVIDGLAIFPGAGYVCMAAQAVAKLASERFHDQVLDTLVFRKVAFLRALVVPQAPQRVEMQLSLRRLPENMKAPLSFFFSVTALSDGQWQEPCTGFVEGMLSRKKAENLEAQSTPVATTTDSFSADMDDWDILELYEEMERNGNMYGAPFKGLRSMRMTSDGLKSEATVEVPDIAAVMPAQHQDTHILHPTTFDSMFHVGIPMIRRQHGAGSVMPVHIDELIVSAQASELSNPGAMLSVSASITSTHFRAANIDMAVTTKGNTVLYATGIESRSLVASQKRDEDVSGSQGICYELEWRHDLNFLRDTDLAANTSLSELVGIVCFKHAELSVLAVGDDQGDASLAFLTALRYHAGTLSRYDLICHDSEQFENIRNQFDGYPITGDHEKKWESLQPPAQGYDVVLVSDINSIDSMPILLSVRGVFIMILEPGASLAWRAQITESLPYLKIHMEFLDATCDKQIIVASNSEAAETQHRPHIAIITHSEGESTPAWVSNVRDRLEEMGVDTNFATLDGVSKQVDASAASWILVMDDLLEPILSNSDKFPDAITLLRQDRRIIWLSSDSPAPMHQITGVARTAHAENDELRLVVIHVSMEAINSPRLVNLVHHCIQTGDEQVGDNYREREYRMLEDQAVLIPRLQRSERLNRAIGGGARHETSTCSFRGTTRRLALSCPVSSTGGSDSIVFVENDLAADLDDDAIEIETRAFVLSKADTERSQTLSSCIYAGLVRKTGRAVQGFSPGDEVIAVTLDCPIGANVLAVPESQAILQPANMSSSIAVSIFLPALAAVHGLRHLAHMKPGRRPAVLIHGALSHVGRALLPVAKAMGASILVTAADTEEASTIALELGLDRDNILIRRPSLLHARINRVAETEINVLIHASDEPLGHSAWSCLVPFGQVIVYQSDRMPLTGAASLPANVPRNATVHFCYIPDILKQSREHMVDLVSQAAEILSQIPDTGVEVNVRDVACVDEAVRLLNLGVCEKVILEAKADSMVGIDQAPPQSTPWTARDATYVVAGGMGDLGRRFLLLMARRGAAHLVTLSRRAVNPADRDALQEELNLTRPGCRLVCLQCDVTAIQSVRDAASALHELGMPPVRGVIQSAAILQDRTLETMTFDDFVAATLAKVKGTLNLEDVFTTPHLDFFLMLSSAVNITGASGQANYNAGNAVQDAMAHSRPPGFMSLNIGWIEDAIHTSNDKIKLQGLWRTGLRPIQPEELSNFFDYLLEAASNKSSLCQAVIGFDADSLWHTSARNSNVQSAMFGHVRGLSAAKRPTQDVQTLQNVLQTGDVDAVVDFIATAVANQLSSLISVDAVWLNERDGSILDLGLDSLVAIELRNWITREFKAPLQSSEIMTNQPIRGLAQKVATRSSLVPRTDAQASTASSETDADGNGLNAHFTGNTTLRSRVSSASDEDAAALKPLPRLPLQEVLDLFEQSRLAVDPEAVQAETHKSIHGFLHGTGPELHRLVQQADPGVIADAYDEYVYLQRREPLPEVGSFTFIHPIDAPRHPQAHRAAIVTVAALDFKQRLFDGKVAPGTLHGEPLTAEGREWLFHATRIPAAGVDRMERHAARNTVAVLCRGHIFEMDLTGSPSLDIVQDAFEDVLKAASEPLPPVCTLTADDRDSWAHMRQELGKELDNAAALACLDAAAFVICLDDESPTNSEERYNQFLLNNANRPFYNRWLDKTLQFPIAANGLSAMTLEHSKLDGLDARSLHTHIVRNLFSPLHKVLRDPSGAVSLPSSTDVRRLREHRWKTSPSVLKRIGQISNASLQYGPLGYDQLEIEGLGLTSLRPRRLPPNATAHLTVLLALYLVDGEIRPAWEKVSLGTFSRGRVEWVQTVSTHTRSFIEAAVGANGSKTRDELRALFSSAVTAHSRCIAAASHGHGVVRALYALRWAARQQHEQLHKPLPDLFESKAWNSTRRGGPGQDAKQDS
ncbi:hypothetical protein HIM_07839 [Hirsutella minnesotensis 3608]|uniref:Uncharacterized protein n=1 Tax=Hirsutella minnesotensis 3608 TaxID=1043627 RepID=A0A0F8A410_9HYPO|nr:hypothetical protein HIM_07839 [Hirsutella minnesotensis 3608]